PSAALAPRPGAPSAVVSRRRRGRGMAPATLAESVIDAAAAAKLKPAGYMLYPALPDSPQDRDVLRFSAYGVGGDIRRLIIASAAASLAGLLTPIATGSILGVAIPHGRFPLLTDMLLLLLAAPPGGVGFPVARRL